MDGQPAVSEDTKTAVGALMAVAQTLREVSTGLETVARQMLGEPLPNQPHVCRPPAEAPLLSIYRCPCGASHRMYPNGELPAGWREI